MMEICFFGLLAQDVDVAKFELVSCLVLIPLICYDVTAISGI